jgi:tRNA(adenine34) deaminase
MSIALDLAKESFDFEEVPVGAVVVNGEKILGKGRNTVISDNDVSSHAEINAIRNASVTIGNYRLNDCVMYVTLEPCHMCAKAIVDARICSVIFGCPEPKTGSIISIDNFFDKKELNHNPQYQNGLFSEESSKLLKDFFSLRR